VAKNAIVFMFIMVTVVVLWLGQKLIAGEHLVGPVLVVTPRRVVGQHMQRFVPVSKLGLWELNELVELAVLAVRVEQRPEGLVDCQERFVVMERRLVYG